MLMAYSSAQTHRDTFYQIKTCQSAGFGPRRPCSPQSTCAYHHHSWHGRVRLFAPYAQHLFSIPISNNSIPLGLWHKGVLGCQTHTQLVPISWNLLDASEMVPWMLPHHVPLQIKNIRATSQVSKHQQERISSFRWHWITILFMHAKIVSREGLEQLDVALYAPTIHDKITYTQRATRFNNISASMILANGSIITWSDPKWYALIWQRFVWFLIKDFLQHIQAKSIVIRQNPMRQPALG